MNHQPFENWLLSDEPLSPDDNRDLEEHLEICQHCQDLQEAWSGVLDLFQDVPELEPTPGFVNRFQDYLMMEKQMETSVRYRWQSMIMLTLIINAVAGLVVLLGTQFLTIFDSPISLLLSGIYRLASFVALINVVQNFALTLYHAITSIVPTGIWVVLALGLVGSVATWIISITSLAVLPRRT